MSKWKVQYNKERKKIREMRDETDAMGKEYEDELADLMILLNRRKEESIHLEQKKIYENKML